MAEPRSSNTRKVPALTADTPSIRISKVDRSVYGDSPSEDKGAALAEQRYADGARPSMETTKRPSRPGKPKSQTAAAVQGVRKPRQKPLPRLEIGSDVEISRRIKCGLERDFGSVPHCEGEFWRYYDTHWEPVPEDEMRRRVHECDGLPWGTITASGLVKLGSTVSLMNWARSYARPPFSKTTRSGSIV